MEKFSLSEEQSEKMKIGEKYYYFYLKDKDNLANLFEELKSFIKEERRVKNEGGPSHIDPKIIDDDKLNES